MNCTCAKKLLFIVKIFVVESCINYTHPRTSACAVLGKEIVVFELLRGYLIKMCGTPSSEKLYLAKERAGM